MDVPGVPPRERESQVQGEKACNFVMDEIQAFHFILLLVEHCEKRWTRVSGLISRLPLQSTSQISPAMLMSPPHDSA